MRKDEEFARLSLDIFLKNINPSASIDWEEGEDPPDYYLTFSGQKFAVEVTTLSDEIEGASSNIPRYTADENCAKLVREVEQRAEEEALLSGSYVVMFSMTMNFAGFNKARKELRTRLLEYIKRTQTAAMAPEEVIEVHGHNYCSIRKRSSDNAQVRIRWPGLMAWGDEMQQKACELLQAAISVKSRKLSPFQFPKILLLHNYYNIADIENYLECMSSGFIDTRDFHSIFGIGKHQVFVLFTINPGWRK